MNEDTTNRTEQDFQDISYPHGHGTFVTRAVGLVCPLEWVISSLSVRSHPLTSPVSTFQMCYWDEEVILPLTLEMFSIA